MYALLFMRDSSYVVHRNGEETMTQHDWEHPLQEQIFARNFGILLRYHPIPSEPCPGSSEQGDG